MASDMATRRLRKELMAIKRTPVDNIVAAPLESNILEWHYVITGTKGSPYEGGFYHGKLKFPPEYPMKPPSVMMLTPNGRFACSRRLCLSMSDFHPESWNPMWSVSTILMGLYSFMLDTTATLGSVTSTTAQKKKFAAESLEFNCKNSAFRKLFPDLVELNERRKQVTSMSSPPGGSLANQSASSSKGGGGSNNSRSNPTGKVSGPAGAGGSRAGGVPPKAGGGGEDRGKTGIWGITFFWLALVVAVGMMIVAYVLRPSLEG